MNKHECEKCRECCGIVPITEKEIYTIKKYCKQNNIKAYFNPILLEDDITTCKFLCQNKCLIYAVRPYICRNFTCKVTRDKLPKIPNITKFTSFINYIEL